MSSDRGTYGQRSSRSADLSLHEEFERVLRMSARQRALLALRLGQRERKWKKALGASSEGRRDGD